MPDFCAAYGCSRERNGRTKEQGITFHKFPKDKVKRQAWAAALRRKDFVPKDCSFVCSRHFQPEDFDRTGQSTRLKEGVIPSVFNFPDNRCKVMCSLRVGQEQPVIDSTMSIAIPPQRKNRKYDMKFKLSVVKYAEEHSGEAAARHFSIDAKRVRVWRRSKSELQRRLEEDSGKSRLPGGGRKRASEELEINMREWVASKRARHERVSRRMIKAMAKETYATVSDRRDEDFTASTGWLNRFLQRNNLMCKRGTTIAREFTEKLVEFLTNSSRMIAKKKIADRDVIAMDETAVWFDMVGPVISESTGYEKIHLTVVLAAKADGTKLKPFLVFKDGVTEVEAMQSINGAVITSSKDGWMNNDLTVEWLRKVLGKTDSRPRLLVWDSDPCHVSQATEEELKQGYEVTTAVIPGGCMEYIQASDVVWNQPFNASVSQSYSRWMAGDTDKTYTSAGNVRAPAHHLLVAWVIKAWEELDTELVKNSFKVCGLTVAPDGSEDHLIQCFKEGKPCSSGGDLLAQARRETQKEDEMVMCSLPAGQEQPVDSALAPAQRKNKKYDMKFKLSVVKYAEEHSGEAAARHFSVDPKRVRDWRKSKSELQRWSEEDSGKSRLPGGGRKKASEQLEINMREWVASKRARQERVSRRMIKAMAKKTYATVSDSRDEFAASTGWLNRFLQRNNFTSTGATVPQKDAGEVTEKLVEFVTISSRLIEKKKMADKDVIAMDETAVWFDMGGSNAAESTGQERIHLTVVLAAKADGTKLKPFLIFKGSIREVKAMQSIGGPVIASSTDGLMNDNLTVEWLRKVLGKFNPGPRLLVWDSDPWHVSRATEEELKQGYEITTAVIPGGCTEYIQAADVVWNQPFNASLLQSYDLWMAGDTDKTYTTAGNVKAPSQRLLVAWVVKAWEELDTELVKKSFKVCGLTVAPDGSEDHLIQCFKEGEPCSAGRDMLAQARREDQEEEEEEEEAEQQEEDEAGELEDEMGVESAALSSNSDAAQCWTLPDIKQEKEEEEEQPVSQGGGNMLGFTDQEDMKQEDQDQDQHMDNPVKTEEPDSNNDGQEQPWFQTDIKEEKEEEVEEPISQGGSDLLDSPDQNPEQHPEDLVTGEEPDSDTNNKQKPKRRKRLKQHCCQFCEKAFTTASYLKIHQKIHTGEDLHSCDQCGKTFTTDRTLNDHMRIHTGQKPYCCEHCGKTFTQDSHLRSHQLVHTGQKSHSCAQCGKAFTSHSHLQRHQRIHTGEKPYSCEHCGKSFADDSTLKDHRRIHTGEKPHWCDQCGKSFTQDSTLRRHQLIHSGQKRHCCELCGKRFIQDSNLKIHQRIHTGEKPYWCEQCGKTFAQDGDLKKHLRTHTGEKPYRCEQCGKTFTTDSHLKCHQRTHTGEKPYKCEQCGKTFTRDSTLKRHQQLHTGEKPFWCEQCGKSFSRDFSLKVHQRIHTAQKNFWCEQCGKTFSQSRHFKKHKCIHIEEITVFV